MIIRMIKPFCLLLLLPLFGCNSGSIEDNATPDESAVSVELGEEQTAETTSDENQSTGDAAEAAVEKTIELTSYSAVPDERTQQDNGLLVSNLQLPHEDRCIDS